ncbi:MAG: carboxypeptidase regulatory-like domain-containing protein [Candidatus Acidiferrales bacterium]
MLGEGSRGKKAAAFGLLGIALVTAAVLLVRWRLRIRPIQIIGAVISQNEDPMKESPIAGVEVSAVVGSSSYRATTDFTGYFHIPLIPRTRRGQVVTLSFRHPEYKPLDVITTADGEIHVIRMESTHNDAPPSTNVKETEIGDVRVRYSSTGIVSVVVGTAAKTFRVINKGNVPCDRHVPCSPDGRWKASVATGSLDAGPGSTFEDARLLCIAGPCPFTKVDKDGFSQGGRNIQAVVRDWSDTTTFLLQAEAVRLEVNNAVRTAYPVILGTGMNFTLPQTAEGPSILAELNGQEIVFPLPPKPSLSWADCEVRKDKKQAEFFRCQLKSGYKFRGP